MLLVNAFSLNMLPADFAGSIQVRPAGLDEARAIVAAGAASAVGHADTAAILSGLLGTVVPAVRSTVTLVQGDEILVAQYTGPRLPEGATTLPAGANITFRVVSIIG